MQINTSYSSAFGFTTTNLKEIQKEDGTIDFSKVARNLYLNPGPGGWGCAGSVGSEAADYKAGAFITLIPLSRAPKQSDDEYIQTWIELLNKHTLPIFSIGQVVNGIELNEILVPGQYGSPSGFVQKADEFLVVIQTRPEIKGWKPFMNLAMFTMVRYLYRQEYAMIPRRTLALMKEYPNLSFLRAMYVATRSSSGSDTFTVHTKSLINRKPLETFEEVLKNISSEGIIRSFSTDKDSGTGSLKLTKENALLLSAQLYGKAGKVRLFTHDLRTFHNILGDLNFTISKKFSIRQFEKALSENNIAEIVKTLINEETTDRDAVIPEQPHGSSERVL